MYVDLEMYAGSKKAVQDWLLARRSEDLLQNITKIAVYSHLPCVVAAFYAGEVFGWPEELLKYIETLKSFYGYTKFINKPEGCPVKE